jgi:thiosulfate reductase cytochrome b subunit
MQDVQVKLPPGLVPSVSNHKNSALLMLKVRIEWSPSFTEVLGINTSVHFSCVFLFLYAYLVFAAGKWVGRKGTYFMS